jgi:hypothetical protein
MSGEREALFKAVRAFSRDGRLSQRAVDAVDVVADELGMARGGARSLKDAGTFYKAVRSVTGSLDQVQVDVIEGLLKAASHHSTGWVAYELATAWHEARLKPIEEWGKGKGRKYGVPDGTGQIPYGRGLVQLTWDYNYAKADKELGLNGALVRNYALALRPDIAVRIMVEGMEEGWFTGRKLANYMSDERGTIAQFREARRIINGTDKADMIAGYAQSFQAGLTAGGWA